MNKVARTILIIAGILLLLYALWTFKVIVTYVLLSLIFSLLGRPIVDMLGKIRYKRFHIPKSLRAGITLLLLWLLLISFFRVFVPLIALDADQISRIDIQALFIKLQEPMNQLEEFITNISFSHDMNFSLETYLRQRIGSILNVSLVSGVFTEIAGFLGNIFVASFAVSFITFFFLKDEKLFGNAVLTLVPLKYGEEVRRAFKSIRHLLMRYFIGLALQVTGIILLVTFGLTMVGIGFRHGLVIGLIAGIMNVIPYIGPLIGTFIGVSMGLLIKLSIDPNMVFFPFIVYLTLVFLVVQVTDNTLFQPLIYSSSVHAHPLEIFLVILMAGSVAGIAGMILAIPVYTILRVFAKEFFNNLRIVKKLTENI